MAISQAQFDLAKADPKLANIVYHDWEAESYDDKWSISYDQRCVDYARNCFDHVVPRESQGSDLAGSRVVELGSGTGFFLLNLMQSGIGGSGIVTDLSSGMVSVAVRNGKNLGLDVTGLVADAELLPFVDSSVDLVVGHAVLHHVPDLDALFAEVNRVLRPGGRMQIVTAAPGDEHGPFMFADLARKYLKGPTRIFSSAASLDYYEALDWLPQKGFSPLSRLKS